MWYRLIRWGCHLRRKHLNDKKEPLMPRFRGKASGQREQERQSLAGNIFGQEPLTSSPTTNWIPLNKSHNFWGSTVTSTKWEWKYLTCHNVRGHNQRGVKVWDPPQISQIGTWYTSFGTHLGRGEPAQRTLGHDFLFLISYCPRNSFLCSLLARWTFSGTWGLL